MYSTYVQHCATCRDSQARKRGFPAFMGYDMGSVSLACLPLACSNVMPFPPLNPDISRHTRKWTYFMLLFCVSHQVVWMDHSICQKFTTTYHHMHISATTVWYSYMGSNARVEIFQGVACLVLEKRAEIRFSLFGTKSPSSSSSLEVGWSFSA